MNHIINEKLEYARKQGIVIKAEIENLQFKKLASIDFSALLSNMLDNAIEALMKELKECQDSEGKSTKELHVIISKQRGYETICVKNRIEKSVLEVNPELSSTKDEKDNHGIGIGKIKAIAEDCGGMYDIYEEDKFFCVKVFIPE